VRGGGRKQEKRGGKGKKRRYVGGRERGREEGRGQKYTNAVAVLLSASICINRCPAESTSVLDDYLSKVRRRKSRGELGQGSIGVQGRVPLGTEDDEVLG